MPDKAHAKTDRKIEQMEKRLSGIYSGSADIIEKKAAEYFRQFERLDEKKRKQVENGTLTEAEYKRWRKNKLLYAERFKTLQSQIATEMLNVNKTAVAYVNGQLPEVYAINYNSIGETVGGVGGYSFTMVDANTVKELATRNSRLLPYKYIDQRKDKKWNMQNVHRSVLQSILTGESIPDMAKRLRGVEEMNRNQSIRTARTLTTAAENKGRQDGMEQAVADGIILEKYWIATYDKRTRDWHEFAGGRYNEAGSIPIDEPFLINGQYLMHPGDSSMGASGSNIYNCRCTMGTVVKGFEDEQVQKATEEQNKMTLPEKPIRPRKSDFNSDDEYQKARKEYRLKKDAYEKQLDEIVQSALNEKQAFQTKEEVIEWAREKKLTIDDEVLESIDLRSFNEVKSALEEMFERFPQIRSYEMESFDGTTFKTTFNIGLDDTGLLSANGGFNFNKRFFSDYGVGLRHSLQGLSDGFYVRGDGSFSTLVRHEFGHSVQAYIESYISIKYHHGVDSWRVHYKTFEEWKAADEAYKEERSAYESELIALAGLKGSSEYSKTNTSELFAEGFAEYTSGRKTEFGVAFGKFLERWLK